MYLNSFSGVNVIREKDKLITSVYRKPTFNGVYTHFDSFLPDTYKIAMICTIVKDVFRYTLVGQSSISNWYFQERYFKKMAIQKTSLIDVLSCS